jgi:hypothetical protein
MSDSKPTPSEKQEADSFLGRLSVVVFYLVMAGALVAALVSTRPDSIASESQRRLGDLIIVCAVLGWVFFLTIVYLAGRYSEVLVMCVKALGVDKPKIDGHIFFNDGLLFWTLPIPAFIVSGVCWWILWRIPDAINWVGELFRG